MHVNSETQRFLRERLQYWINWLESILDWREVAALRDTPSPLPPPAPNHHLLPPPPAPMTGIP